jgi:hypothetical protein
MITTWADAIRHVKHGFGLNEISPVIRNNKEFLLDVIKYDYSIIKNIHYSMFCEFDFVSKLIDINGNLYLFASHELKMNKHLIMKAIENSKGKVIVYVPADFIMDSEVRACYNEYKALERN